VTSEFLGDALDRQLFVSPSQATLEYRVNAGRRTRGKVAHYSQRHAVLKGTLDPGSHAFANVVAASKHHDVRARASGVRYCSHIRRFERAIENDCRTGIPFPDLRHYRKGRCSFLVSKLNDRDIALRLHHARTKLGASVAEDHACVPSKGFANPGAGVAVKQKGGHLKHA